MHLIEPSPGFWKSRLRTSKVPTSWRPKPDEHWFHNVPSTPLSISMRSRRWQKMGIRTLVAAAAVQVVVTSRTQRDQVFLGIVAELTAKPLMVNLKIL